MSVHLFIPFAGTSTCYAYPYNFRGLELVRFGTLDGAELYQRLRRGTGAKFRITAADALAHGDFVPLVPVGEWYAEHGLDHADAGRRHRIKRLRDAPMGSLPYGDGVPATPH